MSLIDSIIYLFRKPLSQAVTYSIYYCHNNNISQIATQKEHERDCKPTNIFKELYHPKT